MNCRARAPLALALAAAASLTLPTQAGAADLPQVKLSQTNTVPACTTPGRLMAFLEARNQKLDPKFSNIAADYMRIGDEIGIRWDTAFFQMLLETGNLTFKGDVSIDQNNFAGLGATGRKQPGESFPDVATGVKAHLQHLLLYAGETIENPVAERTRKVQEWGVLTTFQKSIKGPMTFALVAKQWAPTSRAYSRDIGNIADAFYEGPCNGPDPKPELLALGKPDAGQSTVKVAEASATAENPQIDAATQKISGADLARRAVEEARASGSFVRSNLGAQSLVEQESDKPAVGEPAQQAAASAPAIKILNAQTPVAEQPAAVAVDETKPAPSKLKSETQPHITAEPIKTAAVIGAGAQSALKPAAVLKAPAKPGCKVWTASYGGTRAIIIKARTGSQDNFTVLDVNEGSASREVEAYIAAYAKGGETVAEFANPEQALDKAFELCPEG